MKHNEIVEHMQNWQQTYSNAFRSAEDFWKYFWLEMERIWPKETISIDEIISQAKKESRCKSCGMIGLHNCPWVIRETDPFAYRELDTFKLPYDPIVTFNSVIWKKGY